MRGGTLGMTINKKKPKYKSTKISINENHAGLEICWRMMMFSTAQAVISDPDTGCRHCCHHQQKANGPTGSE
jgi:hypothetical protein